MTFKTNTLSRCIDGKFASRFFLFFRVFILFGLIGCAAKKPVGVFDTAKMPAPPQYNDLKYWAAHPDKADNADKVPANTDLKDEQTQSQIDVFFLHPTTYTYKRGNDQWNGSLQNEALNKKTDEGTILYQASLFNGVGRVFAPRYRQAHYGAFFSTDKASGKQATELAYTDVKSAFEYYLKTWNGNRPIIIAAHSQGTIHATRLLKEFFDKTSLRNRLVIAYIVGIAIPKMAFENIPICESPDQTGCFCSWRTFKKSYIPKPPVPVSDSIASVNPLSMTTDGNLVSAEKHLGGVLTGFTKTKTQLTDAQNHKGLLWISKPKFKGSFLYRSANYHPGDFNIFYLNVREDAKRRVGLFWKR
jgi:hypothetical protein